MKNIPQIEDLSFEKKGLLLLAGREERTTPLSTGSYQDILGRVLIRRGSDIEWKQERRVGALSLGKLKEAKGEHGELEGNYLKTNY